MAAMPGQRNPFEAGGDRLMGALLGGDAIEADARATQELANARVGGAQADFARKVDEARMAAQKRLAREQTEQQLREALPDALKPQAGAFANLAAGYATNFSDIGRGIGQLQEVNLRADAVPALQADGVTRGNALLGALQGKPLPGVDIDSGYEIRGQYGASPTVTATPGEMADIGVSKARAANVGSGGGGGGSGRAPPNYSTPARHKLFTALGGEKGAPDPARTAEFLKWQADAAEVDPQYRDGDYALAMWSAGRTPNQPEQFDFGAGPTSLPTGVNPDVVSQLTAVFTDRKVRGLPELTPEQKRQAYISMRDTGTWADPTSRPPAAAKPASRGVVDRLTGIFEREVDPRPAQDVAKGNAGATAATVSTPAVPPGAIQLLRSNPGLAAQFEAKYGVPAAQYLR